MYFFKLQPEIVDKLMLLDHRALKVYLALTTYAAIADGVCYPGYTRLKEQCGITSGRDIRKAIEALVDAGLINTWMNGNKRQYQLL